MCFYFNHHKVSPVTPPSFSPTPQLYHSRCKERPWSVFLCSGSTQSRTGSAALHTAQPSPTSPMFPNSTGTTCSRLLLLPDILKVSPWHQTLDGTGSATVTSVSVWIGNINIIQWVYNVPSHSRTVFFFFRIKGHVVKSVETTHLLLILAFMRS